MADGHGGYRQPSSPAAVSLPGRESSRTDRGPRQVDITGGSYGSSQAFQQQQSAAPLSAPAGAPGGPPAGGLDLSGLTPMDAPTSMPGTPVTDGAAAGPGGGPEILGSQIDPTKEDARAVAKYLPTMIEIADSDNASPAFRKYVRQIIQNL